MNNRLKSPNPVIAFISSWIFGLIAPLVLSGCEEFGEMAQETSASPALKTRYINEFMAKSEVSLLSAEDGKEMFITAERLVFPPQYRLITYGQNLTIVAEEIVAEGALIETFPEGSTSGIGAEGGGGGTIAIKSQRLIGTLQVFMRGEHGADGREGAPGKNGEKGKTGTSFEVSKGHSLAALCGNPRAFSNPAQGHRGDDASPGEDGEKGENGGATGDLFVEIADLRFGSMELFIEPGRGGLGGNGGPPGIPGDGGDGGVIKWKTGKTLHPCNRPPPSLPGNPSHQGSPGQPGARGKVGTFLFNDQPFGF
jgi:hypothetical protein